MSSQSQVAAKAAGRAVDVSAEDFDCDTFSREKKYQKELSVRA